LGYVDAKQFIGFRPEIEFGRQVAVFLPSLFIAAIPLAVWRKWLLAGISPWLETTEKPFDFMIALHYLFPVRPI
jgi:hypothetical protein